MTVEIEQGVREFLTHRRSTGAAADVELDRVADRLDSLYWREVERVLLLAARESPERIVFPPDARLLLDLGCLDFRLLPGGDRNRPAFLREIYAPGRPNQFYFSEWAAERYRQFVLYGGMKSESFGPEDGTQILRDRRTQFYQRIRPLFANLPGFNKDHVEHLLSGRIDETLRAIAQKPEGEADARAADQSRQLGQIRTRLLSRARDRARSAEELALFDSLRELDRKEAKKRGQVYGESVGILSEPVSLREREEFVRNEVKLLRYLLKLGVAGSGLSRTSSVLLTDGTRLTKADLDGLFALVRDCDPGLPSVASVVIAPYRGGGFYEWDRDTIVLPLVSTRPAEESVVSAVARYRELLDRNQEGERLRKDYEAAFGGEDFHEAFVRDYKAWVLGVGKGFQGALDPARFAFFREHLGPRENMLYAPRDWWSLTPSESMEILAVCRERINRAEGTFEDHYRLAMAASRDQEFSRAVEHLQLALRLFPVDGRALLALGYVMNRMGGTVTARKGFGECMALAPGTIWSVYAAEELQKLT